MAPKVVDNNMANIGVMEVNGKFYTVVEGVQVEISAAQADAIRAARRAKAITEAAGDDGQTDEEWAAAYRASKQALRASSSASTPTPPTINGQALPHTPGAPMVFGDIAGRDIVKTEVTIVTEERHTRIKRG